MSRAEVENRLAERFAAAAAELPSEGETRQLVVSRGMWRSFAAAIADAIEDLQKARASDPSGSFRDSEFSGGGLEEDPDAEAEQAGAQAYPEPGSDERP